MIFTCDFNSANISFLLEQKKIELIEKEGLSFYYYRGQSPNRKGWLFPVDLPSDNSAYIKTYITTLFLLDASPSFVLMAEEQKNLLEKSMSEYFPQFKITISSDSGDSDYIYDISKISELPGKNYQKKRNHISRFKRTFGEDWCFHFYAGGSENSNINQNGPAEFSHIQEIYEQWGQGKNLTESDFLLAEKKSLEIALRDFDKLKLISGVLYVQNQPAAFLIASFTTAECINAHFEKCLDSFADAGALSVLNQQFAKCVKEYFPECKYLNREEDLNISGLRKSKQSYQPEFLIQKFYGKIER